MRYESEGDGMARITIGNGDQKGFGAGLVPGGEVKIGRAPDNGLSLGDTRASRYHARIVSQGDAFLLEDLGDRGFVSAMVEGGPSVASSFLQGGFVDKVVWYTAPRLAGGRGLPAFAGTFESMDKMVDLHISDVERIGPDIKISATIDREN